MDERKMAEGKRAGEIRSKLQDIEEQENVRILYAAESGSRAWGFASPDSDYDVRFIYVRTPEDYLRLDQKRDVIEWQLDEVFDMNGWDIRKALTQFHKSNTTLFEWSHSPIVYWERQEWKEIYESVKGYFRVKPDLPPPGSYHETVAGGRRLHRHLTGKARARPAIFTEIKENRHDRTNTQYTAAGCPGGSLPDAGCFPETPEAFR